MHPVIHRWFDSMNFFRDTRWMAAALIVIFIWDLAALDLAVVRLWGDAQGFAWRDHWVFAGFLHDGIRKLAWLAVAVILASAFLANRLDLSRALQLKWLGIALAISLLVSGSKQLSSTSCPWSLTEFGGVAHYVSHWFIGVSDGGPGKCFPSGHVVNAFAFLPGYFLYIERRPRFARGVLAVILVIGVLAGLAQVVRGAHYPSHILWSAWLCWALSLLGCRLVRGNPTN